MRKGSFNALRRLSVLPVAFALVVALALPATALAADEPLSGYTTTTTTTTTPTTTTTTTPAPTTTSTTPTPTSGTSPEKQSSTPEKSTAPETSKSEPEPTATTAKKATTLPFTGFDLRWTIGAGVLLLAMGFSLVTAQRRQGRRGEN